MKNLLKKMAMVSVVIVALANPIESFAASSTKTAKGPKGQTLTVSQTVDVADGTKVTVTGKNYNTKIGIYVTYCVIPKKGTRPELCGPYDITGQNNQSVWVSSNPPPFADFLVTPFSKTGGFKVTIPVMRMIGNQDCTVVRCAVLTRADHTRGDYRQADVIIPVSIKK